MSVIGLDIGNESSIVGIARKKGIDVLLNNESKRETPSMVGFGPNQRAIGTAASAGYTMNFKNTVNNLKRFIGRKYDELDIQDEIKRCFYKITKCEKTGGVLMQVNYMGELRTFTPTEVLAMLLGELQRIAQAEQGAKVTDTVISVPCYFTDIQRHAVTDAAEIAGLKCLRLINDMTAVSLAYGIYKTDLPEPDAKPLHVAFVDVGHSDMQVAIVAYNKGKMKILGHAYDKYLGGRDFDAVLSNHFAAEFKEKFKIDVSENGRAQFRLTEALSKAKKVLSANAETPINIECLMNDTDVRSSITREKFEELSQNLLSRVLAPCEEAIMKSELTVDDIDIIELVGNSSRIPSISSQVSAFFKKDVSRHLNASECVARGCALQGAMLSPTFRFTREFDIQDAICYPIGLSWLSEGGDADDEDSANNREVFPINNCVPSTKMLTFFRSNTFDISASYTKPELFTDGAPVALGKFTIGPVPAAKDGGKQKLKVKVRVNINGTVGVESAQIIEEEIVESLSEPKEATPTAMETEAAGDGKPEEDTTESTPMEEEPKAPEIKKKIKRTDVPVTSLVLKMSSNDIQKANEKEFEMCFQDRIVEETKEKRNEIEEYVLKMRTRLYQDLEPYITPDARDKFSQELTATEDWLYEDGEDETKGVYIERLNKLKDQGNIILLRFTEDQSRNTAANGLSMIANDFKTMATSGNEKYAHIEEEEKAKVVKECDAALKWLDDKIAMQTVTPKTEQPVLLCADITKKRDVLLRVCEPIMNKPKPKPKPAPAPTPTPAPAPTAEGTKPADGAEDMKVDEAEDAKMSNADDLD